MKHRVLDKMIENYNIDPHLTTDWNVHTSYGTQHLLKNQIDWVIIGEEYKDSNDKKWYPGAFELNNYKYISRFDEISSSDIIKKIKLL